MRLRLCIFIVCCAFAVPAHAQLVQPSGATRQALAPISEYREIGRRRTLAAVPERSRGNVWPWLGVGALGGAVAGGVWGAWVFAHTDDAFFPQYAIGGGAVVGAVTGAVVGGLLYAVTR
jgi:hypothetical protein